MDAAPVVDAHATPEVVDKAPIINVEAEKPKQPKKDEDISVQDMEIIEDALDSLGMYQTIPLFILHIQFQT